MSPSLSLREVKLSVVSYLTNSIVDQILQELYATHKTLVLQSNFSLHSSVHSEHVRTHRSASRICSSSQLRQVSQMRRLEDGGTARRAHRHADILDVVEDDFGISIVSVSRESRTTDSSVCLVVFTVSVITRWPHHLLSLQCSHSLLSLCTQDTIAIKKRSSRTRRIRPVSNRLSESHTHVM